MFYKLVNFHFEVLFSHSQLTLRGGIKLETRGSSEKSALMSEGALREMLALLVTPSFCTRTCQESKL